MIMYELDPDIVRWGLHHLLDVSCVSFGGSPGSTTRYEMDLSQFEHAKEGYCEIEHNEVENDEIIAHGSPGSITDEKDLSLVEYVKEGYCEMEHDEVENDEIIAHAFQEELSQLAAAEAFEISHAGEEHLQASILAQDWQGPSKRHCTFEQGNCQDDADGQRKSKSCSSMRETSIGLEDWSYSPEMASESTIDGEVGKRLNQMVPVPHVPKINGEIPSVDEETSDHQRLLDRLHLYDLVELKVQGDGNCQFRSLSDQIYRTTEHHIFVRQQVVNQLKSHRELYEGYVPMPYDDYLKRISKIGEWGDHVTLQAAADAYGVKVFIITSFRDTCYIEILPHTQKSKRIIFLSFWAEVHYNSIYPEGDLPSIERKQKWW